MGNENTNTDATATVTVSELDSILDLLTEAHEAIDDGRAFAAHHRLEIIARQVRATISAN